MYTPISKILIKDARKLAETTLSDLTVSSYETQVFTVRVIKDFLKEATKKELNTALQIIETSLNATESSLDDFDQWDLSELIEEVLKNVLQEDDFYLELPCGEVRVIDKEAIQEIWHESVIEQIKECYDLSNVPSFVEIDWDATAENCKVDGLGHHFSSYDGEEHETENHYIFRTN